ncbi:hypothetical protein, partial [Sphingobacterium griseoflavum]
MLRSIRCLEKAEKEITGSLMVAADKENQCTGSIAHARETTTRSKKKSPSSFLKGLRLKLGTDLLSH